MKRFTQSAMVGGLVAVALLTAAPLWAADGGTKDKDQDQDKQAQADQKRSQADQKQAQADQKRSQAGQRSRSRADQEGSRQMSSERREALRHFAAGYLFGYLDAARETRDRSQWYLFLPRSQQEQQDRMRSRQGMREQMRNRMRDEQAAQSARQRPHQISGEILRTKEVDLRGTDAKHLVVLLKTRDDKQRIVDLGDLRKLKDLDLGKGDKITVKGRIVKAGDRIVLRADRVQAKGKTAELTYTRPQARGGSEGQRGGEQMGSRRGGAF